MTAPVVTGHSTVDRPYDCSTFETGYSAIGGGGPAANDRLRSGRTSTPDPELSIMALGFGLR